MAFLVASRVGVCGFHWLMNVGHMGLYNDAARNQRIEKRIDRLLRTRDFAPIVDIGDDSFLATLCAMKLQDASETPVYSFEPRELSRLRWQAISESNGVSLAIIAGHPSNPQVAEVFGKEGIRNVVWNCDLYSLSCWGATSVARANTLQRRIEQYKSCIGDSWTDLDDNGQVKARRSMQRKGQVTKLMLGEYGSAERAQSGYMAWEYSPTLDDNTDTRHREVVQIQTDIAIKEGLEYILYWQVYCNDALVDIENPITRADAINGVHAETRQLKGYWLIRPDGSYTEAYRYFRGLLDPSSLYFDGSLDKTAYSVDGAAGGVEISGMLTSQSPLSNMDEKKDYADMVSLYGSKDGKNFEEIPLTAFYTFAAPAGGGLESEVVFINSLPIDTDYRHFEIRKNENCPATLDRLKIYKPNPEDIK